MKILQFTGRGSRAAGHNKPYYTAEDIQERTGRTPEDAARWIREKRAELIKAGKLPPVYPHGAIPACYVE